MQSPARHTGALVPWACATIVFLVSLGVVAGSPGDGVWTVDCGSKELQARRLVDTGYRAFDLGYTARALDPSGRWFPVPSPYALRRGDRYFAQYPVAYAAVAAPFFAVFGPVGLRVPAALGLAACAALIAAWVAPALGRRWSLAAGLGVPLATPLVFYGVTIWEHSLTVALALGAQLLAARAGRGRLAAAGFLIGCATWFREELFLMGLALAAALLATRRRPAELLWLALGALPAALGLLAFNALVLGHPLGSHILGNVGAVHSPSFGEALRDVGAIIAGYGTVPAEGAVFVLVVVVCLVAGWQTGRSGRALGSVVAGIAAVSLLAWLLATVRLANASHPVLELARTNGFALRMPVVALAGAGAARVFARSELSPLRFGMAVGLFFLAFGLPFRVLWTDFLAGFHWAPRMLLPAVPSLAVLGVVALRDALRTSAPRTRHVVRVVAGALLVSGAVSSAQAVQLLDAVKAESHTLAQLVIGAEPDVIVTDQVGLGQQLPSVWERKALLLVHGPGELGAVVAELGRAGIQRFAYVTRPTRAAAPRAAGLRCERVALHRGVRIPVIFDLEVHDCRRAPTL